MVFIHRSSAAARSAFAPILAFLRNVAQIVNGERLTLAAGGLAYFTVLSLVPTLFAFGAIASLFLSTQDIRQAYETFAQVVPAAADPDGSTAQALETVATSSSTTAFTVSTVFATAIGIYAASRVVIGVRSALDAIFGAPTVKSPLIARLISAVITLGLLVVAAVGAFALTVIPTLLSALELGNNAFTIVNAIAAFLVIGVTLRWIYRHGPHFERGAEVAVPWLSPGVWFAALWIMVVTGFLGLYVSVSSSVGTTVLALGASVVLLLWLYLVAFGALLGAAIVATSDREPPQR
jgi:membrane protein